jgi:hypothetical protein
MTEGYEAPAVVTLGSVADVTRQALDTSVTVTED